MWSRFALAVCMVTASSWPGLAQQAKDRHDLHTPQTRVGQVSQEIVAQLLRGHGFSDIANLRLEGGVYRAEASKDGSRVNVEVDAISGRLLKP